MNQLHKGLVKSEKRVTVGFRENTTDSMEAIQPADTNSTASSPIKAATRDSSSKGDREVSSQVKISLIMSRISRYILCGLQREYDRQRSMEAIQPADTNSTASSPIKAATRDSSSKGDREVSSQVEISLNRKRS